MSDLPASRRIILSAVACVLVFGLVEGVLWLAGLPTWSRLQLQTAEVSAPLRAASETLRQHVASPGRARAVEGRSYWLYTRVQIPGLSVNSRGFRGPEPTAREPGEIRVAMLGGSSVYGWLVPDDLTVPALLERELSHRLGLPVTVFNLGVEGHRFQQEVELAEDLLPVLDVDVVVALHGVNDTVIALDRGVAPDPPRRPDDPPPPLAVRYMKPGLSGVLREAVKRSRLVTAMLLLDLELRPPPRAPVDMQLVEGLSRMHLELSQHLVRATGPGIPVVVFLQPALPLKAKRTFTEDVRLATAERRQPGISALTRAVIPALAALDGDPVAVHDLSGLFDADPETRFQDFVHLVPEGNALVARSIAGDLLRELAPAIDSPR
jgi:hypothetical protein